MTEVTVSRFEGGRRLALRQQCSVRPLVSVIIVVFNARHEIEPLLKSIFALKDDCIEIVVIDGSSDDGTLELLQQYGEKIDYWLSTPDDGIYDAMNRGLRISSGEYVLHLNAGDRLRLIPHDALRQSLIDQIDVLCCCVLVDGRDTFRPRVGLRMKIENTWHHQGTFYRRVRHLLYDKDYKVYEDFDLNQRMLNGGRSVRIVDSIVAEHLSGGISVTGRDAYIAETYRSVHKNSGLLYVPLAFIWLKLGGIRKIRKLLRNFFSSASREHSND